jgi:hypothetical protein
MALIAQAATFTVTSTNDSGAGSLRQAIDDANNNAGLDNIKFNIPGGGVRKINVTTGFPTISDPVIIDGYTQPGASANTLANGDNAVLLIEIDGSLLTGNYFGFYLMPAGIITGLAISNFVGKGSAVATVLRQRQQYDCR